MPGSVCPSIGPTTARSSCAPQPSRSIARIIPLPGCSCGHEFDGCWLALGQAAPAPAIGSRGAGPCARHPRNRLCYLAGILAGLVVGRVLRPLGIKRCTAWWGNSILVQPEVHEWPRCPPTATCLHLLLACSIIYITSVPTLKKVLFSPSLPLCALWPSEG